MVSVADGGYVGVINISIDRLLFNQLMAYAFSLFYFHPAQEYLVT